MHRLGLTHKRSRSNSREGLTDEEWWLPELARALEMPGVTLYHWVRRGWVSARQQQQGRWVIRADKAELERLRWLHQLPRGYHTRRLWTEETPPTLPRR